MRIIQPNRLKWWLPTSLVAHRGYGFQSPYLFHLIRNVIFSKEGIYAVEWAKNELEKEPCLNRKQQKTRVKSLYLVAHLSIAIRPNLVVIIGPTTCWLARILRRMHPESNIVCISNPLDMIQNELPPPPWDMMIVTNGTDVAQYIEHSCVSIIDRPHANCKREKGWLRTAHRAPTALDLYHIGIVIYNKGVSSGYRRIWF